MMIEVRNWKKRILSLVLCFAMVMTMLPSASIHAHATEAGAEATENVIEPAPVCDCGTDDGLIHATTCAVYVAPENPVCDCAEKCTEVNEWCDVCGFDYTACTGTDTAAGYAEGDVASVTVGETTTNYTSLDDALSAAQNNPGSTLTLLQNIDRGSEELMINSVPNSTFTIDLNGCTLTSTTATGTVYIHTSVNLTIVDSKGTGGIISGNNGVYIDWGEGTTVNIKGVTITATDTYEYEAGVRIGSSKATVNIIDSTIISENMGVYGSCTLNISGNTSITATNGNSTAIYTGGALTITGGSITGGVYVVGGTADIIGGTITEPRDYYNAVDVVNNAQVTISGGSITGGTADLCNDSDNPGVINLTLSEGKTVGATFPGGITVEGTTLAELLATETATYWGVVDGKDTMLTVVDDAATGITDKGDITIRAICDHTDVKLDYTTTETTHTPVCSVCNWTIGEATEHTGGTATCQGSAVCKACGVSYGDKDANIHTPTEGTIFTVNDNGTHSYTCACGAAVAEVPHTLDVTTGKCVCGADMTVVATVTDGSTTLSASDAATLNQAVTAILETGSRTFTVELPSDAEAEMITAIRRAICDTDGVANGSINLTLKGVTTIPENNYDGIAFGSGDICDEAGEIVDQEHVTQLASVNLPDVTEIGAQAFYYCENLVSVSAPKVQTIGQSAFSYTALTSVEFPELTTIPYGMFVGTWTLSSAKFPKVTTIEKGGLLIGAKFKPENNPTPFPLELTAEGVITFNGSNHFNIAEQNYSGKVDLVLCCDKKDDVTFHDDGTGTWQVRDDLSYTFKSITFKHSYVDGKCESCTEDCTHTGGTATCTEKAVCILCGESYGEVDTTNHDSSVEYEKGFCPYCDAYEPATDSDADGVYEIKNGGNLFWFANYVNTVDRTASAVLTDDIDLENRPWTPIGSTGENSNNFRGVFDGQNHTIRGLNVTGGRAGLGFFGEVRTGTVKNFTIYGEVVVNTEVDYVGGVIGSACGLNGTDHGLERNGAIIQNITSYVNLTAGAHGIGMIGGFVGYANHQSLIENCSWYGTFDAGIYRVDSGAGGFIGKIRQNTSEVTIRNCAAYGTIKTNYEKNSYNNTATIYMGGFLSFSDTGAQTLLENCLFAGKFERGANLTDEARLGAFGTLRSVKVITNCYYLGDDGLAAVHSDSPLKPNSEDIEITSVTKAQLLSGEVAYWLQGEQTEQVWGQTIGTEDYPVLNGEKVYFDENANPQYFNEKSEIISVTITWGDMSFTYTDEAGWNNPDTAWVQVENTGNAAVTVGYDYVTERTDITGSFFDGTATVTAPVAIDAETAKKIWLCLDGRPSEALNNTTIGSVKLIIE